MLKRVDQHLPKRQRRERDREFRQRRKAGERVYPVMLPDSIVDRLAVGLRPKKADRSKPMPDREWRDLVGRMVAEIVKASVENNPRRDAQSAGSPRV